MAKETTERVSVYVPRERTEEDPNLFVGINGKNYLVPKGKTSQVPQEVAEELERAEWARHRYEKTKDARMHAK